MKKIRVGVVGLGTISKAHLDSIKMNNSLKLVGVTDHDREKAVEVAETNSCQVFKDDEELVKNKDIELVILLTPPSSHERLITACANNGKHIFAEKPIGTRKSKIVKYLKLCKENNVKLSIVSQHRFDESAQFIKDKVDNASFGKLSAANCIVNWYRDDEYYNSWHSEKELSGGGVLAIQAIHTIDLMLWFMGEVEFVKGFVTKIRETDLDVEDTAAGVIKFKNGSLGMISATTSAYPGTPARLDILGDEGSAVITGEKISFYKLKISPGAFLPLEEEETVKESSFSDPGMISTLSLGKQYDDVIDSIRNDKPSLVSGEEAYRTFEVIDAIYKSSETGKEIFLNR